MTEKPNCVPGNSGALTRRSFVKSGALVIIGAGLSRRLGAEEKPVIGSSRLARVGLVTDLHYADKVPRGSRHYRETLEKFEEAALRFEKDKPDLVVELGDLIDAAESVEVEMNYLKRINREFSALPGAKHYVLGNHCVDTLKKEEFLGEVGQEKSFYSFDSDGVHFVVLDSCFRSDGVPYSRKNFKWTDANIPAVELEWLTADLRDAKEKQTIVFAHQRLDGDGNHTVRNAPEVRKILQDAGNVKAVFQGHSHKNDHVEDGGIHYLTMVAMVEGSGEENNGYSTLDIFEDGTLVIEGHRRQGDYRL